MSFERWALIVVTLVLLALGSVAFNRWIDALNDVDPQHGYSAWLVVVGVTYTTLGSGVVLGLLLGWTAAAVAVGVMFVCYLASGAPMIAGDMRRAGRRRREASRREE